MNLISPLSLLFGLGIPVIVAMYLLKPRYRDQEVSSTLLWEEVLRDLQANAPWQKLQRNLLLILQILTVAILTLLLARPGIWQTANQAQRTVFVLDGTASMAATDVQPNRLEAAKKRIRERMAGIGANREVALVLLSDRPRIVQSATSDHDALNRAMNSLVPTDGGADLATALNLVDSLVQGVPASTVIVLSDGRLVLPAGLPQVQAKVEYERIGQRGYNLSVQAVAGRPVGKQQVVMARLTNCAPKPVTTTVELRTDNRLVGLRTLTIPAGGETVADWKQIPQSVETLMVSIPHQDDLAIDDQAWGLSGELHGLKVLLVTKGNVFLERALALIPGVTLYRSPPGPSVRTAGYEVVVGDGWVPAAADQGAFLLWNPSSANRLVPTGAVREWPELSGLSGAGSLLRFTELTGITVRTGRVLQPPPWAQPIIGTEQNCLAWRGERTGQRIVAFGFDLHDSNLPLKASFPILVRNIVDWLGPSQTSVLPTIQAGELASLPVPSEAQSLRVQGPGDRTWNLKAEFPAVRFEETGLSGIYHVQVHNAMGESSNQYLFVVAPATATESNTTPLAHLQLPSVAGIADRSTRSNLELWPWLAMLLLALLVAEWWVYQRC